VTSDRLRSSVRLARTSLLLLGLAVVASACGALIGLDDVDRVACVQGSCPGNDGQAPSPTPAEASVNATDGGSDVDGASSAVWDDFERNDGPLGTSASGHLWTVLSGAFDIAGKKARKTTGPLTSIATLAGQQADGIVSATLSGIVSTAGQECGLGVRWVPPIGGKEVGKGYILVDQANYNRYVFVEVDGNIGPGDYVDATIQPIPTVPANGDRLSIEMRGDRMKIRINGTEVLDKAGFALNVTSALHGISASWNPQWEQCRFDDYRFEP
jgi:hypothetical protein